MNMEKINKHNYEAYFLDYLEGNLSAEEKHDLLLFLEANPELKVALDLNLEEVSLKAPDAIFDSKAKLKVEDDSLLNLNTAETWMLESVEGNLSASKQQELEDFIRKHQLEKTYTAYRSTVLKPDLTEVFGANEKLKVGTGLVIPLYARVAAIAAVAVLLIGIALNQPGKTTTQAVSTESGNQLLAAKNDQAEGARKINFRAMQHAAEDENAVTPNGAVQNQQGGDKEEVIPGNLIADGALQNEDDSAAKEKQDVPDNNVVGNQDKQNDKQELVIEKQDDVAIVAPFNSKYVPNIVTEEPYKIVTNAASNVTKREVQFTRDKNVSTNEYVAYGFRIGNFEFERKK